jgi:hypothetical protein
MLKSYPPSAADSTDSVGGYLVTLAEALAQYPACVAVRCADPLKGVASTTKFKPTVCDLTAWCDHEVAKLHAIDDRDAAARQQAIERHDAERHERETRVARPTLDELCAKHGPNWGIGQKFEGKLENLLDEAAKQRAAQRAERDRRAAETEIRAEYSRRDRDPIYAGDMLITPDLADQLCGKASDQSGTT